MRIGVLQTAVLVAGLCGCRPEATSDGGGPPLSGAEENVLGARLTDQDGGFSYRMPLGWSATRVPELKFQLAQEPKYPGYRSNIRVTRETVPLRFDLYVRDGRSTVLGQLQDATMLEESDFVTVSGIHGRRWMVRSKMENAEVLQIFYLFPGPGDDKPVMTASCTVTLKSRMVFVFDAAAKTLRFK